MEMEGDPNNTLSALRKGVLAIFVFGVAGTCVELFLLGHVEGVWQLAPIVLMIMSILQVAWHLVERKSASLRAFQITMVLFLAAGAAGSLLHGKANMEFELELHPSSRGTELFSGIMTGATPALAPGAMIQLGLLGLGYSFRHPALLRRASGR